jgi:hypothetical protein
MASKKKAPTDDELGELFSGLGDDSAPKKTTKPKTAASKALGAEDDILAELENQLGDQPPARPHTPRVKGELASKRSSTATPPPAAGRPSEDKSNVPRKSGESTRSYHASFTPSATSSDLADTEKKASAESSAPAPAAGAGGGWWGGIFAAATATATATASAAMKQAEAAYKEIQTNEDAKKYLEQVRGNVGAIRNYGESHSVVSHSQPSHVRHATSQGVNLKRKNAQHSSAVSTRVPWLLAPF